MSSNYNRPHCARGQWPARAREGKWLTGPECPDRPPPAKMTIPLATAQRSGLAAFHSPPINADLILPKVAGQWINRTTRSWTVMESAKMESWLTTAPRRPLSPSAHIATAQRATFLTILHRARGDPPPPLSAKTMRPRRSLRKRLRTHPLMLLRRDTSRASRQLGHYHTPSRPTATSAQELERGSMRFRSALFRGMTKPPIRKPPRNGFSRQEIITPQKFTGNPPLGRPIRMQFDPIGALAQDYSTVFERPSTLTPEKDEGAAGTVLLLFY